ncbi:hypothetical protein EDEG_04074 [Edhazardia aedis USNM 41457]|uniref:Uncharacterized protein n=1 Tax=Edhazardia aedis (strain USNM 41457) TaxID=1003232 RepID=J9DCZ3_EDHAE|nr:hypothetical protein EDEG_04074 [Edhazardia aedis USNM 41457]|eukprot:EJW05344.1 hypothetical protein EDEG_04074 [Edhazardia aedis USNM 41457]
MLFKILLLLYFVYSLLFKFSMFSIFLSFIFSRLYNLNLVRIKKKEMITHVINIFYLYKISKQKHKFSLRYLHRHVFLTHDIIQLSLCLHFTFEYIVNKPL